ncbi:MAG: energy transducer TonB [Campylobacterota bacterium]|nr:energy transducer TonB [Campylobacterota bacterium]
MSDRSYFYLSAFISLGLYAFFILLFMLYLRETKIQKISSFSKNTVIQLDIMIDPKSLEKNKPAPKQPKKIVKEEVVVNTSINKTKTADFKSLFANVKTSNKKVVEKEVDNTKVNPQTTRFKAKFVREKRNDNINLSKTLNRVSTSSSKLSMSPQSVHKNDPYYSKIYEIISSRWNPMFIIDGLKSVVIVTINNQGNFSYRIKKRSSDSVFNDSLIQFLNSQTSQHYPPYEKGNKTNIEVVFKSKG